jgi:hypothetical protein
LPAHGNSDREGDHDFHTEPGSDPDFDTDFDPDFEPDPEMPNRRITGGSMT